jgi:hypothetical protein
MEARQWLLSFFQSALALPHSSFTWWRLQNIQNPPWGGR